MLNNGGFVIQFSPAYVPGDIVAPKINKDLEYFVFGYMINNVKIIENTMVVTDYHVRASDGRGSWVYLFPEEIELIKSHSDVEKERDNEA